MNRKAILSFALLMLIALQASAQKVISSGTVRTEISNDYTTYWQMTNSGKKLKWLDGHYRINYPGQYTIGTFEKGIPVDTLRIYLNNGNVLKEEFVFDPQGMKHGRQLTFHENGQRASEAMYVHGNVDGLYREWYENGNRKMMLEVLGGIQTGLFTQWNEDGRIMGELQFEDGRKNGKCRTWLYNQNIETFVNEEHYRDDQLVDTTYFYRIEKDDRRVLRSTTVYDDNSVLQSFDSYDNGVHCRIDYEDGKEKLMTQHTNGILSARTEYKNGIQHGESVCYYPNTNQLYKTETYRNGELISMKEYDTEGKLVRSKESKPE